MDLVVGLEAAVGQDEDGLGIEPLGERGDGAAVVGVGAGGSQAGGLPEQAAEEPGELADQQAGAAALVDALLAGRLDERLDPLRQGRGVEAAGTGELVDQAAAEVLEVGVGQPAGPARRSPRRAPPGAAPRRGRT